MVNGLSHITGGAFEENVPRVLPEGLGARIRKDAWQVPPIFPFIQQAGEISDEEMYRVFNMGLGMVLVCSEKGASAVQQSLPEAKVVGRVVQRTGDESVVIE
jgi:phosphoribosylformylglycinamidine cyclo-ligase